MRITPFAMTSARTSASAGDAKPSAKLIVTKSLIKRWNTIFSFW